MKHIDKPALFLGVLFIVIGSALEPDVPAAGYAGIVGAGAAIIGYALGVAGRR